MEMEITANALAVLEKRYLKKKPDGGMESPADMFRRVANNIAQAELVFDQNADVSAVAERFYQVMTGLDFLPNSPTLMNAGRDLQQLSACFVLPVEDSLADIFETIKHTALIHQSGGGTGFSFSRLRPKDDVVQSTHGVSSGPVSFMGIFDAATDAIKQGGTRRGANMGILRVDHPDILEFIECKREPGKFSNFNISVAITDAFMSAVEAGLPYPLVNPRTGQVFRNLEAREVFDKITELAWASGDPGVIFIDALNRDNPTPNVGAIESTNPCGEQPLLPYESCNLGSINLARMVKDGKINWERIADTVNTAVHFLDNVIEMNRYPLPQIAELTRANRKIGLGVMGFADLLIKMGVGYNSPGAQAIAEGLSTFIQDKAYRASVALAQSRGPFPNFQDSLYAQRGGSPLRNATVTTIAPTGTISMIAGCSSGIEPLFALCYEKHVMDGARLLYIEPAFERIARENGFYSDELMRQVAQHGSVRPVKDVPDNWRKVFVTAHDISPEWHVRIQAAWQKGTDNAVSKTVNLPHDASIEEVRRIYRLAYALECKGVTIYRDGCKGSQVLYAGTQPPSSGHLTPRPRPNTTAGSTYKIGTGCGNLYVTINQDEQGTCELFAQMGKTGGCASSQLEAVARMVSLSLRAGVDPRSIREQLAGIRCPLPSWQGKGMVLSCADAIARTMGTHLNEPQPAQDSEGRGDIVGMCPECGNVMEFIEGCAVCKSCGHSRCGG
jgi:ribonucleoside-diphosphate reductase alpha chain